MSIPAKLVLQISIKQYRTFSSTLLDSVDEFFIQSHNLQKHPQVTCFHFGRFSDLSENRWQLSPISCCRTSECSNGVPRNRLLNVF